MKGLVLRRLAPAVAVVALLAFASVPHGSAAGVIVSGGAPVAAVGLDHSLATTLSTTTPIKHLVVIFQENVSFDHYFGTYPYAANPPGEPVFTPRGNTPAVNGLTPQLLTQNPNSVQPFRLDRLQALTCDQSHTYTAEQQAEDNGLMDKFVQYTEGKAGNSRQYCPAGTVMGYYDGNTVTALWNYAQHFAMSDNAYGTLFGPSTPGALDLVAADTYGAICGPATFVYNAPACSTTTPPATSGGTGTVYRDADPYYDDCANKSKGAALTAPNIGNFLDTAGITWGWFQGGFADCKAKHPLTAVDRLMGIDPATDAITYGEYDAHHNPFQYFASTANPHHLPPSSAAMIGQTDQANHLYDLTDFWTAADAGNMPAVSFLKAPGYQDGHAGSSDPLDEQEFLVDTISHLMSLPSWRTTAIIVQYDDSDGWYDHVRGPIVNHSATSLDFGCGTTTDGPGARCGYGPRLPYLVISPYARDNDVDHTLIDQTSTTRFIEDNWLGGERLTAQSFDNRAGSILGMFDFNHSSGRRLFLDPQMGTVLPDQDAFEVDFSSMTPDQGMVYFGSGPGCTGLVEVATQDAGTGTTEHRVLVTGNDLPGSVGDNGIVPGTTYWYETVTFSPSSGQQIDNNGGKCYSVTVPSS
ncbi:MAG TPA: alkaline phosphatase family protein [Chloroflexota bacterium]|nr:alkaline phosphatase family protein [Chloroflexota bacterium]